MNAQITCIVVSSTVVNTLSHSNDILSRTSSTRPASSCHISSEPSKVCTRHVRAHHAGRPRKPHEIHAHTIIFTTIHITLISRYSGVYRSGTCYELSVVTFAKIRAHLHYGIISATPITCRCCTTCL